MILDDILVIFNIYAFPRPTSKEAALLEKPCARTVSGLSGRVQKASDLMQGQSCEVKTVSRAVSWKEYNFPSAQRQSWTSIRSPE